MKQNQNLDVKISCISYFTVPLLPNLNPFLSHLHGK